MIYLKCHFSQRRHFPRGLLLQHRARLPVCIPRGRCLRLSTGQSTHGGTLSDSEAAETLCSASRALGALAPAFTAVDSPASPPANRRLFSHCRKCRTARFSPGVSTLPDPPAKRLARWWWELTAGDVGASTAPQMTGALGFYFPPFLRSSYTVDI